MQYEEPNRDALKYLPEEVYQLEDMLYEAISKPNKNNPYPKDVIYLPQVRIYWDNWGKEIDIIVRCNAMGASRFGFTF